jgi:hypothetical protein
MVPDGRRLGGSQGVYLEMDGVGIRSMEFDQVYDEKRHAPAVIATITIWRPSRPCICSQPSPRSIYHGRSRCALEIFLRHSQGEQNRESGSASEVEAGVSLMCDNTSN